MIQTAGKKRTTYIFFLFCLLYGCIIVNLFFIQIRYHSFYLNLGQKQYHVTVTQAPPRAAIYDRTGKTCLALNKECVSAFILPKNIESPQTLEPFLARHFPQALERLKNHKNSHFLYVKRRLTDEQIALINNSDIQDLKLLKEPSRFYPIESAAQIVGVTDIDNSGLFGIEMLYNTHLAGTPSTYTLERDARSGHFYFQKETKIMGKPGEPLTLTIDSDLQFLVTQELKATLEQFSAKEGAAIIMDPHNGDILAMTNLPSFDPNNIETLENQELTKNKVITEVYELGSVIKTCAALSAIDAGTVTADEPIDCENRITTYFEGRRINTVRQSAAGIIPFKEVIAKSNNIGIAKVAKRLGPKIYDYYTRLGFGSKTGISFPGEQKGLVNHPNNWSKQSIISLSYGYEISASLLQLARAFSIIANDGKDVVPRLTMNAPIAQNKQLFKPESTRIIKDILTKTSSEETPYRLMYKTGTANTLVNGAYDPNKNLFTCAGIIEKDDYQRVIVVFVKEVPKHNIYAATVAAPLLDRVAKKLLIHDRVV